MNVYLTDKKEEMELGRDIWDIISEDPEEAGFIWDAEQERWTCDTENYAWWDRVADDLAAADALKKELSDKGVDYRRELDEALKYVHDIDDRAAIMRGTLEKIAAEYDREKPEFEIVVDGEIIDTVKAWDADSAADIWQNSPDGWRYLDRYRTINNKEASFTVRDATRGDAE